jgi:hypothetical protein
MYKASLLFLILEFCCLSGLFPQGGGQAYSPSGLAINKKWSDQIFISDVDGRPIKNNYGDVSGSPYFMGEYKYGSITLTTGRTFVNVKVRIDLASQETYFVSTNGVEAMISAGNVKEISFADTTADGIKSYLFKTGFPDIDRQSSRHFYLILAEGKCSYLKSIIKRVSERKSELSGEIAKDFETSEEYYFFANGQMKRVKRDKDFVLTELADKKAELDKYVQTNKLNLKNQEHIAKLVAYYNSL